MASFKIPESVLTSHRRRHSSRRDLKRFGLGLMWGVLTTMGSIESDARDTAGVRFSERVVWNDFSYGFGVQAFDVDGDGLLDLTAADSAEYVQLEPLEGKPVVLGVFETGNFTHVVKTAWPSVKQIIMADLDADGRCDLAAIADYGALELRWWRNAGPLVNILP